MGVTVLNSNWRELMDGLDDATRLQVYDAIFAYAKNRTINELPPCARAVFEEIRQHMERNAQNLATIIKMAKAYQKRTKAKADLYLPRRLPRLSIMKSGVQLKAIPTLSHRLNTVRLCTELSGVWLPAFPSL